MGDWSDDEKTSAPAPKVSDYHNPSNSINNKSLIFSVHKLQKLNKLIGATMIDKTIIMMIAEVTFQEVEAVAVDGEVEVEEVAILEIVKTILKDLVSVVVVIIEKNAILMTIRKKEVIIEDLEAVEDVVDLIEMIQIVHQDVIVTKTMKMAIIQKNRDAKFTFQLKRLKKNCLHHQLVLELTLIILIRLKFM